MSHNNAIQASYSRMLMNISKISMSHGNNGTRANPKFKTANDDEHLEHCCCKKMVRSWANENYSMSHDNASQALY